MTIEQSTEWVKDNLALADKTQEDLWLNWLMLTNALYRQYPNSRFVWAGEMYGKSAMNRYIAYYVEENTIYWQGLPDPKISKTSALDNLIKIDVKLDIEIDLVSILLKQPKLKGFILEHIDEIQIFDLQDGQTVSLNQQTNDFLKDTSSLSPMATLIADHVIGINLGINAEVELNVTDTSEKFYLICDSATGLAVTNDPSMLSALPLAIIEANAADWNSLLSGLLNPQMAFMTGKLRVKGDLGLVTKIAQIF